LQHHGIPPKVRDPIAATAGPVLFTDKIAISDSTWRTSGSVCTSRGMPTSWSAWTVIGEPFEAPIGRRDASGKTTDMYALIRCPNGCPPFKMLASRVSDGKAAMCKAHIARMKCDPDLHVGDDTGSLPREIQALAPSQRSRPARDVHKRCVAEYEQLKRDQERELSELRGELVVARAPSTVPGGEASVIETINVNHAESMQVLKEQLLVQKATLAVMSGQLDRKTSILTATFGSGGLSPPRSDDGEEAVMGKIQMLGERSEWADQSHKIVADHTLNRVGVDPSQPTTSAISSFDRAIDGKDRDSSRKQKEIDCLRRSKRECLEIIGAQPFKKFKSVDGLYSSSHQEFLQGRRPVERQCADAIRTHVGEIKRNVHPDRCSQTFSQMELLGDLRRVMSNGNACGECRKCSNAVVLFKGKVPAHEMDATTASAVVNDLSDNLR
jgi:hypothetical protein